MKLQHVLSGAGVLALVGFYFVFPAATAAPPLYWEGTLTLFSAAAAVSAGRCWRRYGAGPKGSFGRGWQLLALGMVVLFVGEAAAFAQGEAGVFAYPSAGDPFFVSGFALLTFGLWAYMSDFQAAADPRTTRVVRVAVIVLAAVGVLLLVPSVLASTASPWGKLLDLLYPALVLSLLATAAASVIVFRGGRLGRAWWLVVAAIAAAVAGAFAQGLNYGGATDYRPMADLLYGVGFDLAALGFYVHRAEL